MSLIDGALSHRTPAGRALRLPLRLLPAGAAVPVMSGPGAGLKWIIGSGPHSCWLGINERRRRKPLARLLRPGAVFFDVGANVGSYTLLGARLVGDHGRVVAFEPLPENVRFLQRLIRRTRPHLFVAAHSDLLRDECTAFLTANGYRVQEIDGTWELFAAPRARS